MSLMRLRQLPSGKLNQNLDFLNKKNNFHAPNSRLDWYSNCFYNIKYFSQGYPRLQGWNYFQNLKYDKSLLYSLLK